VNPIRGRRFFGGGRGWFGHGGGRGFGRGYFSRGFSGWGYYGVPVYSDPSELSPEEEVNLLKEDAKFLKQQLKELQGYIDTLEKAKSQEKK
jgi:hypothetical protein